MKFRIVAGVIVAAGAIAGTLACGGRATPSTPSTGTTWHPSRPAALAATTVSPSPTTKPVSAEEQNAVKTASSYLDGQSFSRKGLIDQLKYEGYPAKIATAAVDSLHVDWNKQAAQVAADYLNGQSFSRKGLIDQLEFDGFTHEQAVYGVSKAGL